MNQRIDLIKSIKQSLNKKIELPHQACSMGYEIFLLSYILGHHEDDEVKGFQEIFIKKLPDWGMEDLLIQQINYAIQIAESERQLEYEEMHKLFSLCDEIFALETLGLFVDQNVKESFEESVRKCFCNEVKKSRLVAQDKVEDWSKTLWWYAENIKK